jgi:hypothetical protein
MGTTASKKTKKHGRKQPHPPPPPAPSRPEGPLELWTQQQVRSFVAVDERARAFCRRYGIDGEGICCRGGDWPFSLTTPSDWLQRGAPATPNLLCRVMAGETGAPWNQRMGTKQLCFVGGHEHLDRLRTADAESALRLVGFTEDEIKTCRGKPYRVVVFEKSQDTQPATLDHVLDVLLPGLLAKGGLESEENASSDGRRPWSKDPQKNVAFVQAMAGMTKEERGGWFDLPAADEDRMRTPTAGGVDAFLAGERGPRQVLYDLFYCNVLWTGDGQVKDYEGRPTEVTEYLVDALVEGDMAMFDLKWCGDGLGTGTGTGTAPLEDSAVEARAVAGLVATMARMKGEWEAEIAEYRARKKNKRTGAAAGGPVDSGGRHVNSIPDDEPSKVAYYHNATMHTDDRASRALQGADWSNAPSLYCRFYGATYVPLPRFDTLAHPTLPYRAVYPDPGRVCGEGGGGGDRGGSGGSGGGGMGGGTSGGMGGGMGILAPVVPGPRRTIPVATLDQRALSQLFYYSLANSAIKRRHAASYTKRVNPSSGCLHPIEVHCIAPSFAVDKRRRRRSREPSACTSESKSETCEARETHETQDASFVLCHYAPKEHGLEVRRTLQSTTIGDSLRSDEIMLLVSCLEWRQTWKYGERG